MTERLTSMITQIISKMFSLSQVSKEASVSTSAVCAASHMDMAKRVCQPDILFVLLVAQRATRSKAKLFLKEQQEVKQKDFLS